MKKAGYFFLLILLIYAFVDNLPRHLHSNTELLLTGTDPSNGTTSLFNSSLNTFVMVIGLLFVFSNITDKLRLNVYIRTRVGNEGVIRILALDVIKSVLYILAFKQFIYVVEFIKWKYIPSIYLYDTVSTLLTLLFYGFIFLSGLRFGFGTLNMALILFAACLLAQFNTVNYPYLNVFVIASRNWNAHIDLVLITKLVGTLIILFIIPKIKNHEINGGEGLT